MDNNVCMDYCVYTVLLNNRNFCEASDQNSNLFNTPFPFPAPVSSSSLTNANASLPADDTDDDIVGAYRPHSISRPQSLSSTVSASPFDYICSRVGACNLTRATKMQLRVCAREDSVLHLTFVVRSPLLLTWRTRLVQAMGYVIWTREQEMVL